jgi:hypothetical protein
MPEEKDFVPLRDLLDDLHFVSTQMTKMPIIRRTQAKGELDRIIEDLAHHRE